MSTWPAEDPDWARRLARLERRGRRLGLIALQGAFALGIIGMWTWVLTAWPTFDYQVVPSVLPTYGIIGLAAAICVWLLLWQRLSSAQLATLIVGLIVVVAGLGLGLSAPSGSGGCQSVIGNLGRNGDNQEDCFDARATRADDVAIVVTFGLLMSAAGTVMASG